MRTILSRLENHDLMRQLHNKHDKYIFGLFVGAEYVLQTRLQDGITLAYAVGADFNVVAGILFGLAYSWPVYGEQGAAVLRELDPDYSRLSYAQLLIRKLLNGIETDATEIICSGIQQVMEGKLQEEIKNEILIAYIVDYVYSWADRLPTIGQRNIVVNEYIKNIIDASEKAGRLVMLRFKDGYFDRFELADEFTFDPETAHTYMTKYYNYFLTHFDEIPDDFKRGLEQESRERITACYLSTRNKYIVERDVDKLEAEGKL